MMTSNNTILIVDDEKLIRDIFENSLTKAGYKVCSAESAEQALEILSGKDILVIFSDLKLTKMSGYELCKIIRQNNPVTIIYAVTGYTTIFDIFESRRAGFDDFFIKPFSIERLIKAAQEAFEKLERWNILPYVSTD